MKDTLDALAHTYHKPWLIPWLSLIQGYTPIDQAYAIALAYFADERGILDEFSWEQIGEAAGIKPGTARRLSRKSGLAQDGLILREERMSGGATLMPRLRLKIPKQ